MSDDARALEDPFERFNRRQQAGAVRDPYARWAELAAMGPVVKVDVRELVGAAMLDAPAEASDPGADGFSGLEIYTAVHYDAVVEILRDAKRFTSSGYAMTMGPVMGRTILEMDPPEHTAHRALIQQAFTRRALERWERDVVRPVIDEYIDGFAARGRAELVRELTFPFPVSVVARMMGLPVDSHANFHRWAIELISITFDLKGAHRASRNLRALFAEVLAERRKRPQDDLISLLAEAELDGERLDDEAIFGFLCLLAPAGAETTYRSSSNLLCALLGDPAQLDAVRDDRTLVDRAIEEGLRWECPLTGIMRTATVDTEVCGVEIPAGSIVNVCLAAANRDARRYENPNRFDVHRRSTQHVAFATGAHACLGMHLARMETRVLVESLFDRLGNLRLTPDADDVHVTGLIFRSPLSLPVCFDS